ncbi:hypothetical protein QVD17_05247 [Tagetes erecta]|uniref:Uncharacterized protein n=1 Tax=Tagetes erecta TaxID=13708 RepID=A0AAD8PB16_TARER|nr:hypothetical protein QVD17_05247 [Tagetes erecta]
MKLILNSVRQYLTIGYHEATFIDERYLSFQSSNYLIISHPQFPFSISIIKPNTFHLPIHIIHSYLLLFVSLVHYTFYSFIFIFILRSIYNFYYIKHKSLQVESNS